MYNPSGCNPIGAVTLSPEGDIITLALNTPTSPIPARAPRNRRLPPVDDASVSRFLDLEAAVDSDGSGDEEEVEPDGEYLPSCKLEKFRCSRGDKTTSSMMQLTTAGLLRMFLSMKVAWVITPN